MPAEALTRGDASNGSKGGSDSQVNMQAHVCGKISCNLRSHVHGCLQVSNLLRSGHSILIIPVIYL